MHDVQTMPISLLDLPKDPDDLGFVLPHEHVAVRWPAMSLAYPESYSREDIVDRCVIKLNDARAAGVDTIFDASTIEMSRDVSLVAEVAERTGLRIIMCTGFFTDIPQYFRLRPRAAITEFLLRELRDGISDSGVRAHFVKFSCDGPLDTPHKRIASAVAEAAATANAPLYLHTDAESRNATALVQFFLSEGIVPTQMYVGHVDEAVDIDYARGLLETGCFVGFDKVGLGSVERTHEKLAIVAALASEGHATRLLLSHDASAYMDLADVSALDEHQPSWRHDFIPTIGFELLAQYGMDAQTIRQVTHANPARWIYSESPEGDV